jgi:regulator of cell morphogenesis and NO signaling
MKSVPWKGPDMIDSRATLGDLVTANPARARALEALDLDYCCDGRRTLLEAATAVGRTLAEVVGVLEAVDAAGGASAGSWADLPLPELLEHIVATHHADLRAEAPRLVALGRKVRDVHGDRHPELAEVADVVAELWAALEPHLDEEEATEFPAFLEAVAGRGPAVDLTGLRADHEAVGALLDRLRAATSLFEVPADGCASYATLYAGLAELDADTRLHVHKENNVVFPAVERAALVPG